MVYLQIEETMKTLFTLILFLVMLTLGLVLVYNRNASSDPQISTDDVTQKQQQVSSEKHIFATWDTMEFDKCVAAWLIVRFVDQEAKFVLHPKDTIINEGVVFDVPGAAWSRQHRKCTSDCILETFEIDDPVVKQIVNIAHNVELNFWQLDRFPEAQKCFDDIRQITESTSDRLQCFEKTRKYFDELYTVLKRVE